MCCYVLFHIMSKEFFNHLDLIKRTSKGFPGFSDPPVSLLPATDNWTFMNTCHVLPRGSYKTSRNVGKRPHFCSGIWLSAIIDAYWSCKTSLLLQSECCLTCKFVGVYPICLALKKLNFIKVHKHIGKIMYLCWIY